MKITRYDSSDSIQGQHEPGSRKTVLKNLLGINKKKDIDQIEFSAYERALEKITQIYSREHIFNASDICQIHKIWLNKIYPWAGKYRTVDLSKGYFRFASTRQIPTLMDEFEKKILAVYTPCNFKTLDEISYALAIVHVELELIHPFREGNGRVGRLLSVLMALQADLPVLDFKTITGKKRKNYFLAVQAGIKHNYHPMAGLFKDIIGKSAIAS